MVSTVIALLLAGAVIFWNTPFSLSFLTLRRMLYRVRRRVVLVVLLFAVISVQPHTDHSSSPAANFSDEKPAKTCHHTS